MLLEIKSTCRILCIAFKLSSCVWTQAPAPSFVSTRLCIAAVIAIRCFIVQTVKLPIDGRSSRTLCMLPCRVLQKANNCFDLKKEKACTTHSEHNTSGNSIYIMHNSMHNAIIII